MPKKSRMKKVHYLHNCDQPLLNPDFEIIDVTVLKSIIADAFDEDLQGTDRVSVIRLRYGRKFDGAGMPDFEPVDKLVTFKTLLRWYKAYTGESITKESVEKERQQYLHSPD